MKIQHTLSILIITLFLGAGLLTGCNSSNDGQIPADVVFNPESAEDGSDPADLPVITFDKDVHDFGRVIKGEVVTYAFKFTNTGKRDLLISKISATCGCTATEYPKEPIAPGDSDYIKITFNSASKKGFQNKAVNVAANTQPPVTQLYVRANVIVPEE